MPDESQYLPAAHQDRAQLVFELMTYLLVPEGGKVVKSDAQGLEKLCERVGVRLTQLGISGSTLPITWSVIKAAATPIDPDYLRVAHHLLALDAPYDDATLRRVTGKSLDEVYRLDKRSLGSADATGNIGLRQLIAALSIQAKTSNPRTWLRRGRTPARKASAALLDAIELILANESVLRGLAYDVVDRSEDLDRRNSVLDSKSASGSIRPRSRSRVSKGQVERRRRLLIAVVAVVVLVGAGTTAVALDSQCLTPSACGVKTLHLAAPNATPVAPARGAAIASTGWGPARPTVTSAGTGTTAVLNSLVDNPVQGDERNFFQIKQSSAANSTYVNEMQVVPGNDYTGFIYFHNDAGVGGNIATGVSVRIAAPAAFTGSTALTAFVSAVNTEPASVWASDVLTLPTADQSAALRYVPSSAVLHTGGAADGTQLDAGQLFGSGVAIGCDSLDGKLPSGSTCSGYVTFDLHIDQPNFVVTVAATEAGVKVASQNDLPVRPNDVVEISSEYLNTGTTQQDHVSMNLAKLPDGLTYVSGSLKFANSNTNGKWQPIPDSYFKSGLDAGSYGATANFYVRYEVTIDGPGSPGYTGQSRYISISPATTVTTPNGVKSAPLGLTLLTQSQ